MRMSVPGLNSCVLAVIIIFVTKYLPVDSGCQKGWEEYEDNCYVYIKQPVDFHDAVSFCSNEGVEILEILSAAEQSFVNSLVKRNGGYRLWLGITDIVQRGRWVSYNTRKPVTYTNWMKGEPTNSNEKACGELMGEQWKDTNCSETIHFICKQM